MSSTLLGVQRGHPYSTLDLTMLLYNVIIVSSSRDSKTLWIQDDIFLALSVMFSICGDQDRSDEMSIPRSRIVSVGDSVVPLGVVY